ncbi:ion channel TACAN-like isoform X2 [Syngnathoides biaculeatus]|uniref:ion channel TACAN-like isoform X2 n=1 Tax=Syngnathoides biaculeatus TaxID=300417 RepID=UPI002ADDFC1E|nr:ion channel TACAN-like isoform X2 [Syngnathoides biaculeatus]
MRYDHETYRTYLQKVEEISKLQESCTSSIYRQQKGLKEISSLVKKCSKGPSEADALDEIKEKIKMQSNAFYEMEAFLPRKNGPYLRLVLGNVNVTLLSKQLKFAYKDEYEKFKLYLTAVLLLFSFTCYFFVSYRFLDPVLNFLLVWYYCTLTIRESILITNGSRIKGWWVSHHYVSAFLSAVMLTWPDGNLYKTFRNQFLAYSLYQSFVQCLQCYYQSGCLYRLRALGERHNMDLTVEGFQSWMWKGLTFLLPFLFFGHFWQLFNSLSLFRMAQLPECKEWQVSARSQSAVFTPSYCFVSAFDIDIHSFRDVLLAAPKMGKPLEFILCQNVRTLVYFSRQKACSWLNQNVSENHPPIFLCRLSSRGSWRVLEPIPAVNGQEAGVHPELVASQNLLLS